MGPSRVVLTQSGVNRLQKKKKPLVHGNWEVYFVG